MKKIYLLAAALAALVSCTSDDFTGDKEVINEAKEAAISFDLSTPAVTRGENTDKTAADNLSGQFIVYGEKGETADGSPAASGKLVFKNYLVKWIDNSAYTTTSNTKGWEYVGISATSAENASITPNSGTAAQTIKYWDFGASSYTLTAVSALPADISEGRVKITKIEDASSAASNQVYQKGYYIDFYKTGESAPYTYATFNKLYFADRQVITDQDPGTDRNAVNEYGGNITFKFRNALSQVRAGIYETIPGYAISDIQFKVSGGTVAKIDAADAFGAICKNVKCANYEQALKVTYEASGTTVNRAIVTPVTKADHTVAVTSENDLILGTNINSINTTTTLGETALTPTWDTSGGTFTAVFPQAENSTDLTLTCDYELYNATSGEKIKVTGATAKVPAQYLQWKPNFKYTYLFKISDNTNGQTGTGTTPAGLYPITFDAIEVINGDGIAEYITTVSEPSITTFGVNGDVYIAEHGTEPNSYDYPASTAVYATVMDGSSLATLSATNMKLYTVTTTDATNFKITEASVAEALIEGPTLDAAEATAAKIKLPTNPSLTYQNTVPAEDGTTITLDESLNKAATFTTAASTTYALVYVKTAATYSVSGSTYANETAFDDAGTLYTTDACTTVATWGDASTTYYKRTGVSNKGEYVVKIVTCPAAP